MATLDQEIQQRKALLEKQVRRERLNKWLDLIEDFTLIEKVDNGNYPRLILTIEAMAEKFISRKLPKCDSQGGVHID